MKLKTDALVLRDYKIEDDRILTLLTRDYGVLTAFANGANRLKSQMAGSTELLCFSRFNLFHSRDRYIVDHADAIRHFYGIRKSVEDLAAASYFAQVSSELAPQNERAEDHLRLILNTLHFLEENKRGHTQLKALFELRILTLSGYMPNLVGCRNCGTYEAGAAVFFPLSGDFLCSSCVGENEAGGFRISAGVLAAMRHIIYSDFDRLFSFSLSEEGLAVLARVSEEYLRCRLERTFSSLEFYHALTG